MGTIALYMRLSSEDANEGKAAVSKTSVNSFAILLKTSRNLTIPLF